ncbi:hypothetical protein Plec18167_000509 [Paecilomyces lecythidis]|uniref:Uncharacterized protein n=1 Tax=Paecilomyces lecythidis TaxID=3004212 RepID=A0ABR3YEA4_9EURO
MSFVNTTKGILQNMGHKGNIPATALKTELEDICKLISNQQLRPTSAETHRLFSNINPPTPITMIRDGFILNNALSDVVEIPQSFSTHIERCAGAPNPSPKNKSVPSDTQMEKSSTPARHEEHPLPAPVDRVSLLNEVHIDGLELDGMESSLSFDMADLQWLESVQ